MTRPGTQPDAYITMPSPDRCEGEIELAGTAGERRDSALLFAQQLAQRLFDDQVWLLSSFGIDWAGPIGSGRLYGQMWLERKGTSVHFLSGRLYSDGGTLIAACSGTAHIAPDGTA